MLLFQHTLYWEAVWLKESACRLRSQNGCTNPIIPCFNPDQGLVGYISSLVAL
jgi:hypothetical protein